jgi:uncharacterized oligopeptide transporter (OPT) family protein
MSFSDVSLKELTLRGVILGAVITLIFTASNVYLGLKVGLTFASSIPAAVISMALLRAFADSNILENNIVQTQASAAGTLSAIIFVLPALLMLGYWQGFPMLQTGRRVHRASASRAGREKRPALPRRSRRRRDPSRGEPPRRKH